MGQSGDYEALIRELLAGVAEGWSYGKLKGWWTGRGLNESDLAAWLRQHGERIGLDAEIRAQLVCLANLNRGDLASVAADLIEGWEPQVDESKEWFDRGNKLYRLGRYEEAISSYDRAIEINPDLHEVWYNLGVSLSNLGRYADAIASYDRAIAINPDYHEFWSNRGVSLGNLGRYADAIASHDRAIEIKPDKHEDWSSRGFMFGGRDGYQAEINAYREAFKYIQPETHPEGWGFLQHIIGRTHHNEGNNQLLNYRRSPQIYYGQALTSYNNALQTLTREQFPELRLETLIDTAKAYLAQNNPDAAYKSKTEALDIFRYLLNAQPTIEAKKRFRLKYISLRQLDVELFIATGDNIRALEAAELDKNERLTLLLDALQEQTVSPTHTEMRQLLTSETTGIIY
jgi:tetratricopeptide (TPR) repeat protein